MTQITTQQAEFFGAALTIIDHAGRRWLTAEQVGRALGYDPANARKGVIKLYERHGEEFTEADTFVVKLTTDSPGKPATRIFSDTGCIKLGFFANTPRAKEFRAWAARVLAAQPAPAAPAAPAALPAAGPGRRVSVTRALERRVLELFVQGHKGSAIARHLGLSAATVSMLLTGKYRFAPGAGPEQCPPALINALVQRHRDLELERLAEQQARITRQYCASSANLPLARALDDLGCALLSLLTVYAADSQGEQV